MSFLAEIASKTTRGVRNVLGSAFSSGAAAPASSSTPTDVAKTPCENCDCGLDVQYGFSRPMTDPLEGTVDLYHRHVFVCSGRDDWPSEVKDGFPFVGALSKSAKVLKERSVTARITATNASPRNPGANDVLVFPQFVRHYNLLEDQVPSFVEKSILGQELSAETEQLKGTYIFVCCHESRDKRCGVCGPALVDEFNRYLSETDEGRALQSDPERRVTVLKCSHIGGHKYAGNVIVCTPEQAAPAGPLVVDGEVSASSVEWYGYVKPEDVSKIVKDHVIQHKIVPELWRGRIGMTETEQKELLRTVREQRSAKPQEPSNQQ